MTRQEQRSEHRYKLFGLNLASQIPLPELEPDVGAAIDISICLGQIATGIHTESDSHALVQTPDGAILTVAGVGRFEVRGGREIVVEPGPAVSEENLRLYLLGSVIGAALHQRGMLPLHANAIDVGGHAVAFMGASGAGKSTLAAAFHDHGYPILADDVCVVTRDSDGHRAEAGIPRLRLWRDAVERSGRNVETYQRAFDALDKYTVGLERAKTSSALPLRALYHIVRDEQQSEFAISRLEGVAATRILIENTYRGAFIRKIGQPSSHFRACLELSSDVPVFAVTRPWNAERIAEGVGLIAAHLAARFNAPAPV